MNVKCEFRFCQITFLCCFSFFRQDFFLKKSCAWILLQFNQSIQWSITIENDSERWQSITSPKWIPKSLHSCNSGHHICINVGANLNGGYGFILCRPLSQSASPHKKDKDSVQHSSNKSWLRVCWWWVCWRTQFELWPWILKHIYTNKEYTKCQKTSLVLCFVLLPLNPSE